MRIGFDARLAGLHVGISRYIEELLQNLLKISAQDHWTIYLPPKVHFSWMDRENVETIVAPVPHYTLREQLFMPWYLYKRNHDVLHVPHFNIPLAYARPYVLTIHDLLWHERRDHRATTLPSFMHMFKHSTYIQVTNAVVKRAQSIIVPSHVVKETVSSFVGREDSVVIPEAVSDAFLSQSIEKVDNLPKNFLLYVGSLYPHKNVVTVLDALQLVPSMSFVVVSSRNVFFSAFKKEVLKRGLENQVQVLSLPDKKVAYLMKKAAAFVFPSVSEGFGLPGLESMALELPVIASDIRVFHEVYGEAAKFVDSQDPRKWAESFQEIQQDTKLREELIKNGKACVANYSWKKAAQETYKVYREVYEKTR